MPRYNEHIWWYLARASGIVLWFVLAASVGWGLAISARLVRGKGLGAWMLDLHRYLGTLAVGFTALHLLGLWADSWSHFGPKELLVPMASRWKPGAVAWGIVAMYLLVIVQTTARYRQRIQRRLWHALHLLSLPLLVTGTVHGALAGTDASNRLFIKAGIVSLSLLLGAATFRLLMLGQRASNDKRSERLETLRSRQGAEARRPASEAAQSPAEAPRPAVPAAAGAPWGPPTIHPSDRV